MGFFHLLSKIALTAGVLLLGLGINSTWANHSDYTMWFILSGIALIIGGAFATGFYKKID